MPKKCLLVDVETIPDNTICLDTTKAEFPHPVFHKIVSISYATLGNEFDLQDFKVLGLNEHKEEEALRLFGEQIDDDTMIVTWSGRRFDLPVLLYRSLKLKVPCPWYFKKEFDKRYDLRGHVDLQDHMTLFGASNHLKLDHASALIGLPGKLDTKGSEVEELWARNRFLAVGTYNVTDVVALTVLFIRWAHLRGLASPKEVNAALDTISAFGTKGYPKGSSPSVMSVVDGITLVVNNCDWESLKV